MRPDWRRNYSRYRRLFLQFVGKYQERQDVKMFLEVLLSLVTISIFSIFALRPTIITIAELIKEIEAKKEILAVMDGKIKDLSLAQTLYDQEIRRIRLLDSSVPVDPAPQLLVRQLEGLSAKHSVSILSVSIKEVPLTQGPSGAGGSSEGSVNFSINATAPYPFLFSFLEDLGKTRRPIRISSLSLRTAVTDLGRVLNLSVSGKTPYRQ
ncbi:hypothetical protein IID22_01680 [Patescibacteria group bacterium]|nr:hypothetical protein [Patescibacteria group bacterium]